MITTYYIIDGNDDYDYLDSVGWRYTNTTIFASYQNNISPADWGYAEARLDLTSITDPITAATVYFDESAYSATKGLAKTYHLQMYNGGGYTTIADFTFVTAATRSYTLNETERGWIWTDDYTTFRWIVDNPGGTSFRTLSVKAYETSQAVACRISITTPSTNIPKLTLLGVG